MKQQIRPKAPRKRPQTPKAHAGLSQVSAEQFAAWRAAMGLTQQQAADELGYSRRQIGYFESGAMPVPRIVGLAIRGMLMKKPAPEPTVVAAPVDYLHLYDFEIVTKDGDDLTLLAHCLAQREGWGLYWNEATERLEIQRDDAKRVFESDDAAVEYVRQRAIDGSKLHRMALGIHDEQERNP